MSKISVFVTCEYNFSFVELEMFSEVNHKGLCEAKALRTID